MPFGVFIFYHLAFLVSTARRTSGGPDESRCVLDLAELEAELLHRLECLRGGRRGESWQSRHGSPRIIVRKNVDSADCGRLDHVGLAGLAGFLRLDLRRIVRDLRLLAVEPVDDLLHRLALLIVDALRVIALHQFRPKCRDHREPWRCRDWRKSGEMPSMRCALTVRRPRVLLPVGCIEIQELLVEGVDRVAAQRHVHAKAAAVNVLPAWIFYGLDVSDMLGTNLLAVLGCDNCLACLWALGAIFEPAVLGHVAFSIAYSALDVPRIGMSFAASCAACLARLALSFAIAFRLSAERIDCHRARIPRGLRPLRLVFLTLVPLRPLLLRRVVPLLRAGVVGVDAVHLHRGLEAGDLLLNFVVYELLHHRVAGMLVRQQP